LALDHGVLLQEYSATVLVHPIKRKHVLVFKTTGRNIVLKAPSLVRSGIAFFYILEAVRWHLNTFSTLVVVIADFAVDSIKPWQ
jgi:hypothetical protein